MKKVSIESQSCDPLLAAYNRALAEAFDKRGDTSGLSWPSEYGNSVSIKGTLVGNSACSECGKKIRVTLTLNRIQQATDFDDKPVKLYDVTDVKETVQVSGTPCAKKVE